MNNSEIVKGDVVGAIGGFGGGLVAGASMGTSVVAGAVIGSIAEAGWQFVNILWCMI